MTKREYWLLKIAEEASELAQAAIKIAMFGEDGTDPRDLLHVNNLYDIVAEHQQLEAAYQKYISIAKDTTTWQVLPFTPERLDVMLATAAERQASIAKILTTNGVIKP